MKTRVKKDRKRGQSLVELAFCIIFLALLVLGSAEIGMAFWTSHAVSNASREGARIAAAISDTVDENDFRVIDAVHNYLVKTSLKSEGVEVTNDEAIDPGDKIKVTVIFPYEWITPLPNLLGVEKLNICRSTTMRYAPYIIRPRRWPRRPPPDFGIFPIYPDFPDD